MASPTVEELQQQLQLMQAALQEAQGQPNLARIDSYRIPKIPPFLIKDPVIWFIQVEATFGTARIVDQKTMAHHVIASLDTEAIACCRDLIMAPDANEPYNKLKERIIETFAISAESQLRQLLKGQVLTSGKPSQILARLRNLNPDKKCDDALLKAIFFEYLSPYIRGILATSEFADLDKLAKMADKISETANDSAQCAAASLTESKPSDMEAKVDRLTADVAALAAQLKRLGRPQTKDGNAKNRKRSKSRGSKVCWAHRNFGEKARACKGTEESPCSWPKPKALAITDGSTGE
ncbi:PREDICTED: uncharacterized protein LOC108771198 [Cyphomyrmex costatus]|nr:PREDICTED: uncharacterized protein LOC108771198 [Cyphomyrmex costatus]